MRPRKPWYRRNRGWYVMIDGQQTLLVAGPKNAQTKQAADKRFHELMVECQANPPVDSNAPTVASIIDAFLDYAVKRDAPTTFYERKLYLQKFCDVHGGRLVNDCLPYHLTSWIDSHPTWTSEWTRSYAVRNVKRPFNWAVKQGLIAHNPFAHVEHHPGEARRPMTQAEYQRLLSAADPASGLVEVLQFAASTGCRPCELRSLCWEHVNLELGVVTMSRHKTSRTQRQRGKPRIILLIPPIVKLLTELRDRGHASPFVFLNRLRRPWSRCSLQQGVRRLRRQIGLPEDVVLYGLRHRFGTESIKCGNDLKTTAEILGHTTTRMTEHYVHLAGDYAHLAQAVQRAAKSVSDA